MVRNARKPVVAGNKGVYMGQFKGSDMWHRIPARSEDEARGKFLNHTKYNSTEVKIKKFNSRYNFSHG